MVNSPSMTMYEGQEVVYDLVVVRCYACLPQHKVKLTSTWNFDCIDGTFDCIEINKQRKKIYR